MVKSSYDSIQGQKSANILCFVSSAFPNGGGYLGKAKA